MPVTKEELQDLIREMGPAREMVEIDIFSVDDFKDNLRVGDVMSVGWRHDHVILKVDEKGFWDFCQTGDCGDLVCGRIDYDEVVPESFVDIHPVIIERHNHNPFRGYRWEEITNELEKGGAYEETVST